MISSPNRPNSAATLKKALLIQSLAMQVPTSVADVFVDWSPHIGQLSVSIHYGGYDAERLRPVTRMNCYLDSPEDRSSSSDSWTLDDMLKAVRSLLQPADLVNEVVTETKHDLAAAAV